MSAKVHTRHIKTRQCRALTILILIKNLLVSTLFLISSMILKIILLLFSRDPPNLSVLLLTREERNWESR